MSVMPLAEAQAQLKTVNIAMDELIRGVRRRSLRIGSGEFQRLYEFESLTYENLRDYQAYLLDIIRSYDTELPTFKSATVPLVVDKGYRI